MTLSVRRLANRVIQSKLARATAWMFVAQGGRLVVQGAYFVIIGRALGIDGLGAFLGMLALVSILTPFADWGSGKILLMHVARAPGSFPIMFGNALVTTAVSGSICLMLLILLKALILPEFSVQFAIVLAVSEYFCGTASAICAQAFQALEQMSATTIMNLSVNIARLTAALIFSFANAHPSAQSWAWWQFGSSAAAAMFCLTIVTRRLGRPEVKPRLAVANIGLGWYFALGISAQTLYNDIDKTMMARLSTLEATGLYGAAYRIILMSFLPVRSLLYAAAARFFQAGSRGLAGSVQFAKSLLPISLGYGVTAAIGLWLTAPLVPKLLGSDYAGAPPAIRWLCPLLIFQSIHYFAADALTGAGMQRLRSIIQGSVAVFNILINLVLIPRYSWQGAVASSLMSDALLMILLWSAVLRLNRKAM